MKQFIKFIKREEGAVAVFMAVAMVLLLGFTAFAVDIGLYNVKKAKLQTACDAAALAAVYKMPDRPQATSTAKSYVSKNGFPQEKATVSFSDDNMRVTVKVKLDEKTHFASILGVNKLNLEGKATAAMGVQSGGGVFDYLLFRGDTKGRLDLGGKFNIYGSVHSNSDLFASPGRGYIMGAAQACGTVYINQWTCTVGAQVPGAAYVPMADFTDCIDQVMPTHWTSNPTAASINAEWRKITFSGNTKVQKGNVNIQNGCKVLGNLYVDGNLTISGGSPVCTLDGGMIYVNGDINFGNTFEGDGCIFAKGNITFTGSNNKITPNRPIAIYSETGNIKLTPASTHVHGIVYAPNGDVLIGGGNTTFHGSIIGKTISGIPANLTMYENEIELPFTIGSRVAFLVD
ncbi:MAG TPA: pilus assembly protein TadG-related protein [Clostridiales bacterium]|nr:pilus assembly protein TadG-related protein [Clostridiales bacterium]